MNRKNHFQRKQNKGFTLVEVLIAITILAIIVTPLLHAFVTSSRTNAKAKQLMKATTLAQNVMEETKANSLEEIARQFNSSAARTYTSKNSITKVATSAWEAIKNGDALEAVNTSDKEATGATVNSSIRDAANPTANPEGIFVGQDSGEYHFLLKEVTRESAKFDIALHIKENTESGTQNLTQINAMNQADCGYFAQGNSDNNATTEFMNANASYPNSIGTLTKDEFYNKMERTITVDIASNAGNETVNVKYDYEIESGYTLEEDRYYSESITIFDNYLSGESLKAVYIYYFPLYEGVGRDKIEIVNNNNLDVDVYLIKMQGTNYSAYRDANYAPVVTVKETASNNGQSHSMLCTNIDRSLSFSYSVLGGTLRNTDLGNEKSTECFYDVTVKVYKHNNATPFTEEDRIATFTGSMLDNSKKVTR